jgi:hypothetical protein
MIAVDEIVEPSFITWRIEVLNPTIPFRYLSWQIGDRKAILPETSFGPRDLGKRFSHWSTE